MRTNLAAALGSAVPTAGTLLGVPAAGAHATAYPVTKFDIPVGNTQTQGTLTWQNRPVVVKETQKVKFVDVPHAVSADLEPFEPSFSVPAALQAQTQVRQQYSGPAELTDQWFVGSGCQFRTTPFSSHLREPE